MEKVIKKIGEENNIFGDGIAYAHQYDFSRANLNDTARIEAITTVASVCYDNPNIVGKESLYNRLKAEAMGLPSSSFEFVPVLLHETDFNKIVTFALNYSNCEGYIYPFILNVEKYGEWITVDQDSYLLTNYRALLSDHEKIQNAEDYQDITQFFNTEAECDIIAKYSKTFLYKMDLSTSKQHNRHRVSLQEMCLTGDSIIKTSQGNQDNQTIKELYNIYKSNATLPTIEVYDFKDDVFKKTKIKEVFDTGIKEVFEVTIQYGSNDKTYKIKTSNEHKFLTEDGWKRLKDIEVNRLVAIHDKLKLKYSMVLSIESCGEQQTYDLEVEHEDHNYTANNIVVHNSRRYVSGKKTEFEFYISDDMKDVNSTNEWVEAPDDIINGKYSTKELNNIMTNHYFEALKKGVKPQNARRILPQSMYTTIWTTFLPFQLKNYLNLRDDLHAQDEIRWIAQAMKRLYANN